MASTSQKEKAFEWVDGKRVVSQALKKKKLTTRLKYLGFTEVDKALIDSIKDVDSNRNLYITTGLREQSKLNGVIAYLWCRFGIDRSLKVLPAYDLVEIFLGKNEEIVSLLNLTSEMLVLLYGYQEMENKRQPDFILQVFENRRRLGLKTWFLNLGRACSLQSVHDYMMSNEFNRVSLTITKTKSSRLEM